MKFDQLKEYYKRNIFLQNRAENETERLVPDLFLFFKEALYEVKASDLKLSFNPADNLFECVRPFCGINA